MSPSFAQLGVPESISRALAARDITQPFEIQAATIADAMAGRDVCGRAPTGSGKTLAFGIPLIATVDRARPKSPRGLVLAPTRELADQIAAELRTFAGDVRIGVVYGGVGYGKQVQQLRRGVDVIVACPGRLEDLVESDSVRLDQVDKVVIDEADRMADMGFLPAVRRILEATSDDRQTVLFSATLDGEVATLTRDHQRDPVRHEVGESTPDITAAEHRFWLVEKTDRIGAGARVIGEAGQAIVFCRTRHGSDRVARQLSQRGVRAAALHGGHPQNRRTRTLADFVAGKVQALVATDVAARGIHVDDVAAVVHFDPPEDEKAYIHRSGRTARAGRQGLVVSLVQREQIKDVRRLQRSVGLDSPITELDGNVVNTGPSTSDAPRTPRSDRRDPNRSQDRNGSNRSKSSNGRSRNGAKRKPSGGRPANGKPRRSGASSGPSNRSGGKPSGNHRSRSGGPKHRSGGPKQRSGGPKQRSGGSKRR